MSALAAYIGTGPHRFEQAERIACAFIVIGAACDDLDLPDSVVLELLASLCWVLETRAQH